MRALRAAPAAAALSIALLLGALALALLLPRGGRDENAPPLASVVSARDLQLYDCAGWRGADLQERRAVLATLRRNAGQPVAGTVNARGTVLAGEDASGLFDRHCAAPGSDRFLLYKLYGWATGFAGEAP